MMRGVLPKDPLTRERLVHYWWEEKNEFVAAVNYIVAAIITAGEMAAGAQNPGQNLQPASKSFRESVYPTDKTHREIIERNKERLDELAKQELLVRPVNED